MSADDEVQYDFGDGCYGMFEDEDTSKREALYNRCHKWYLYRSHKAIQSQKDVNPWDEQFFHLCEGYQWCVMGFDIEDVAYAVEKIGAFMTQYDRDRIIVIFNENFASTSKWTWDAVRDSLLDFGYWERKEPETREFWFNKTYFARDERNLERMSFWIPPVPLRLRMWDVKMDPILTRLEPREDYLKDAVKQEE
jgi:hypothetical protein